MEQKRLKLAVICYDNPFLPPAEGGKKGMMSRIKSLLYLDKYDIDLFLLNKQAEGFATKIPESIGNKVNAIKQYQMRGGIKTILEKYPICVNKRYVPECIEDLRNKHYNVAILEGAQVAAYRLEDKIDADHYVLYLHDIESEYRAQIAESLKNPIKKIANQRESRRFQLIETKINKYFEQVWFVSKEECERFSDRYLDEGKGTYLPFPAIKFNTEICGTDKYHRMLYVGDMTVKHNALSMIWFAREVLPKIHVTDPKAELVLIGRISDNDRETLNKLGAVVKGYVEDLDQEYRDAACVVCPVLFGAGVKVKTIDALAMGQLVVTNTKGVEGTELENGKHLLVADDPAELAEISLEVLKHREKYITLAMAGYEFVKTYHSIEHQARIIDECIQSLK